MLSFFRNFTKSRYGLIAVFLFLGLIAIAFAAGDVTGIRNMGSGASSSTLATVGGQKISDADVKDRIERFLRNAQRGGQNVTMEQFLAQGGLEIAIDEMINSAALVEFAQKNGMQVSKKLIDTDIASNSAFAGIDGKFDQKAFEKLLADNRIAPATYRESLTQERYGNWLVNRATIGSEIPDGVVAPYASLLLERRTGLVGLINTAQMDPGGDPDDKTLNAYYVSHRARYLVPQRRVVRFATILPETIRAQQTATEAEISDAFAKAGKRYAATEKRNVRQLVVLDQATANKIAGEVKGGKSLADAAKAAGLEPTNFEGIEKPELTRQTSAAVADAAFAAAQGAAIPPVKSSLGWHIVVVEKVEKIAAKSLAQAHDELASEITQRKTAQALADIRQKIEDGIGDGKNFAELLADAKLAPQVTPALTAQGTDPDNEAYKPDPAMTAIMRGGFAMENPDDDPQLVQVSQEGGFAIVKLDRIVAAAPRPLATVRDKVKTDYLVDKALEKAKAAALKVIAAMDKGVPMAKAFADAGAKGPPAKPFDFQRKDIADKEQFIKMAFSMQPKKARMLEAPDRKGYYIVFLDMAEPHDASGDPMAMAGMRSALQQQVGAEYARQFIRAVRGEVKITRNEAAIARLRADLTRQGVR
ncbi:SurA N-terminal domain-containing protein [Sphingomonas sp. HITSZ_GF]|uniref:peptidylprolyl isomerase n=1 Tax=Sphingomonas sp. HITSZ_GF TaxID=3037247 RepID=UPI00240DEC0C|nr:peptidylprolyl isomerase [Sphingomonas sp. HITSZ_GF]MDG2532506.1 SurA N-terminal domain-containing protein [Sphingomonas sp. HITSZ_GF]